MSIPWQIVLLFAVVMNVVTFLVYGADKRFARQHRRRVPESALLLLAALGGSPGALLGMTVFHHKTRKPIFRVLIPLFLLYHGAIAMWFIWQDGVLFLN